MSRCPHNDSDRVICHACFRAGVRPRLRPAPPPSPWPWRLAWAYFATSFIIGAVLLARLLT